MDILECMIPLSSAWMTPTLPLTKPGHKGGQNALMFVEGNDKLVTPLLFQCGVTFGSQGRHAVYIRQTPFTAMPMEIHGMASPQPATMKLLKIMYLTTEEDLLGYLSEIHCQNPLPEAVLIENVNSFSGKTQDDANIDNHARICSIMVDVASFLRKSGGASCLVAASMTLPKSGVNLLAATRRILPNTFSISASRDEVLPTVIQIKRVKFEHEKEDEGELIIQLRQGDKHITLDKIYSACSESSDTSQVDGT